jgi:hypothetical protein
LRVYQVGGNNRVVCQKKGEAITSKGGVESCKGWFGEDELSREIVDRIERAKILAYILDRCKKSEIYPVVEWPL